MKKIILLIVSVMATSNVSCKTIIVLGASAAGSSAIKELTQSNYEGNIIWIASQKENPYKTTQLKAYLEGAKSENDLSIYDVASLPKNVSLILEKKATSIDSITNSLTLDDDTSIPYDHLLLATGTTLTVPQTFTNISGVFAYHTLEHARAIKAYCEENKVYHAVIIGLGITGLELASVLTSKNINIHAVDKNNHMLSNYIPQQAADFLLSALSSKMTFYPLSKVVSLKSHEGCVTEITLSNGIAIPCELVVFTTGSTVDTALLDNTGIKTKDGGIMVNESMQTAQPWIYAAGDCALITDLSTDLLKRSRKWKDAEEQGKIAAQAIMGKTAHYKGSRFFIGSHFLGFNFQMYGELTSTQPQNIMVSTDNTNYYHLFNNDNGILKGYLILDKHELSNRTFLKEAVEQQKTVTLQDLQSLSYFQSNQSKKT